MKLTKGFSWLASEIGSHGAVAVVACLILYVIVSAGYQDQIEDLERQISEMKAAERNALITKRISEQMEDIAYEQKALSDKQRERAEEQSRLADIERGKAELERTIAVKAEQQARASAQEAENMRQIAEQQSDLAVQNMIEAQKARSQADTLFYQSLARSLAQNSITQYQSGDKGLAALLAYSAWYYTDTYKGNVYHQDIYSALLDNAYRAKVNIGRVQGNPRAIISIPPSDGKGCSSMAIVTDYGEIFTLTPKSSTSGQQDGFDQKRIFSNRDYLFRDACISGDNIIALDIEGMLVKTSLTGKTPRTRFGGTRSIGAQAMAMLDENNSTKRLYLPMKAMPLERWRHLLQTADSTLIAVGEHQVIWLDKDGEKILHTNYIEGDITEAGVYGNTLGLFTKGGDMQILRQGQVQNTMHVSLSENNPVSYYYYLREKEKHILGMENGDINVFSKNFTYERSLIGHSGPITHMEQLEWCFATSGYDHKICLWNINDIDGQIAPIEVRYDNWPLCFATDEYSHTLSVGLANGGIDALHISVEDNKQHVHNHIEREFTPKEWEYYIGKGVKYRRFKE